MRSTVLGATLVALLLAPAAVVAAWQSEEPEERPNPFAGPVPVPAVSLGRDVRPDGTIPDAAATSVFTTYDPIYIAAATTLPDGAEVRLVVVAEDTERKVREDRKLARADEQPWFRFGPGDLKPGRYVARMRVEGGRDGERTFEVRE